MKILFIVSCLLVNTALAQIEVPIALFPVEHYSQSLDKWFPPDAEDYDKPLLPYDYQLKRRDELYNHYFGSDSPWSLDYVKQVFIKDNFLELQQNALNYFSNENKSDNEIGYAENFRPYDKQWIKDIVANIDLSLFSDLHYLKNHRAIAVVNLNARALPVDDPYFYNIALPGQGYPFDLLQMSSIWAGTPVYIVADSKDRAWSYVVTPAFYGWVHREGLARVDEDFIKTWQATAKKAMAATIKVKTPILLEQQGFQFYAYPGAVFPLLKQHRNSLQILIPVRDIDGKAVSYSTRVSKASTAVMPLPATKHQFVNVMGNLLNRPYGWGGLYFYNDCSQELKSLFAPFGIWLPRNSWEQLAAGLQADVSALDAESRIKYLQENGHALMTIVHINGHVFLYLGNRQSLGKSVAMTYQDVWGLHTENDKGRAVIGESVILPLLLQYPEDNTLISWASRDYFQLIFLDDWPKK